MNRALIAIISALALAGCSLLFPSNEDLLLSEDISLTWKGEVQIKYNAADCQIAYSEKTNKYRVYNDRLSYWFVAKFSDRPTSVGQEVSATVSWTGDKSEMMFEDIIFKVEKTDDSGLIWLWNESNSIGVIIKDIR